MRTQSKRKGHNSAFRRTAIVAAAASIFASGAVWAQEEAPAAAGNEPAKLDTIEVTGSRLKRAQVEGALPVATITRTQIEASGLTSAAEVIRATTFNSFGSYQSQSGDSFSSQAQVSLRGLGSERTLVLIDGRRVPPSPVSGAAGVDLNTIPLAAVERIEILQDGASAVYGSDAIGGVVNIILRKDLSDTILSASIGRPTREGGDEASASLVGGKSTDKGRILFGLSWSDRKHIALADREYSSFFPGDGVNFSTIRGANEVGNTLYGYSTYTYYAAPSCAPDRVYNFDIAGGTACIFPFADVAWDLTDLRNTSLFVNGDQEVVDGVSVFYQASYSRVETAGRFAPVADAVGLAQGAAANPLAEDAILLHRFEQLGPRNNFNTNNVFSVLFGANIDVMGVPVEVGVRQSRYDASEIGRNYTNRSTARQFLSDGTYNPYDLTQNSQATLDRMKLTIGREGTYKYQEAYANAQFQPLVLPAGAVQVVVGLESRRDKFADIYDAASVAGIVGGSAGSSAQGARSANAAYIEGLVPVLDNLELTVAARYDDYSDFGSAETGKVSLRYQPTDTVTARASYGTGFRAPTLSDLYGVLANSAPRIRDFTQCRAQTPPIADADCVQTQVNTGVDANGDLLGGFQGSNPDLEAEESDQYSLGVVWAPNSQFDISLDYYNIQLDNAVQFVTFQELIRREADGESLPPGTSVERVPAQNGVPGRILRITTGPANVATIETSGLDLNINTNFNLGFGQLRSQLQVGYVLEYVDSENKPGQDQVNDPGVPEYRATLINTLRMGQFAVNYNINHIASTSALTQPDGTGKEEQVGHVASFTTHDIQAVWYTPFKSELSFGVRNLFDRGPSTNFAGLDNPYYDNTLYDPFGRVPYLSIKQTF
ncbi:MAG TPA: TonB-dependent receptor [Solimonas sp.]